MMPMRSRWTSPQKVSKMIRKGLNALSLACEVSSIHQDHPGNVIPFFPGCIGHVDTFPVRTYEGEGRYAPKYKSPVMKFQIVITNLGFVSFLSGPHHGSASDTTLCRTYPPALRMGQYLLGDKAYISVNGCLPPLKVNSTVLPRNKKKIFNKLHGHYRARVEQAIGWLKRWGVLGCRWRSHDMEMLGKCCHIICCIRNINCCYRLPYIPGR